ncbi:MAG: protein kinase [Kofleriaceae bacterium]
MSGRLLTWSRERATAELDEVAHGELVSIDGAPALVTALYRDHVELAPLSPRPCAPGAQVVQLGMPSVAIPDADRAIDCLGEAGSDRVRIDFGTIPAISLASRYHRLTLGSLVYDLQHAFRAGTSFLAVGPRAVVSHVLRHQVAAGRVVIAVGPGWNAGGIEVTWPDDAVPAQRWFAAWTAISIAAELRARGRHVVVALDLEVWDASPRGTPRVTEIAQLTARSYWDGDGSVSVLARTAASTLAVADSFDQVIDLERIASGRLPFLGTVLATPAYRIPTMRLFGMAVMAVARLEHEPDLALGHALIECLRLRADTPLDSLEQQLVFLATVEHPTIDRGALLSTLRSDHADRLAAIRVRGKLDADDERILRALAATTSELLPVVDPANYEMLEEYARGGLGRIVRAKDRRTGRIVAIKEMLGSTAEVAARFAREAKVTANLQHPAIVPVYELGRWPTGEPFYAMKLVAGRSFEQVIEGTRTLDDRLTRLTVIAAVADALAYAHGQRVIHRDLKPANVLVGEFGETVVIDWGLAKVLGMGGNPAGFAGRGAKPWEGRRSMIEIDTSAALGQTMAGAVLGTPSYMPPEQALGNEADERADVYAIGALLYHLITGKPPFQDRKLRDVGHLLAMVQREPPTPIATLEPETPPDLVTIIEKAMARDADARYPSARELADELRRFTNGQLVQAHRYDRRALVKRWLRKHRATVTVAAALLGVLIVGGALSVRSIISERDSAEQRRIDAEQAQVVATEQTRRARKSLATALYQKGRSAEQQQRWRDAAVYYAAARVQADSAAARWSAGLAEARSIVPVARHFGHGDAVTAAAISADAHRIATVDSAGGVRVWAREDGALIAQRTLGEGLWSVAFSPDGRELAVGGDAGIVHRLDGKLVSIGELRGHTKRIWSLAYSPDGATIASAGEDTTVRLWAAGAARILRGHTQRVYSVSFSPDGANLVSGGDDRALWLWSVATATGVLHGAHENGGIRAVEWSHGGDQIVTAGWDMVIRVWPVVKGSPRASWMDKMSVHGAAMTPDARVIATAGDTNELRFWEASTQRLITTIDMPGGRISAVAMSRDGRWLVTAGNNRVPTVWDVGALPRLVDAVGHRAAVNEVSITHDGTRFVTVSDDRTMRIWNLADGHEVLHIPLAVYCASPQVSRTGILAAGCEDRSVRRWDLTGRELGRTPTQMYLRFGSLSGDDSTVAFAHMKGFLGQIDMATGRLVRERQVHAHQIYALQYGATGQLVTASLDNRVKVWTADLTLVKEFAVDTEDGAVAAALSPDGTIVVAGSQDGSFDAWEIASGKRLVHTKEHVGAIWKAEFAPDGKTVYATGDDGLLWYVDTATWRAAKLDGKEGAPASWLAVSPDSKTVIVTHRNGALVVWDADAKQPRYRLGGNARDHGSCDDFTQQRWVDEAHHAIVKAACTSDPAAYLARIQAFAHERIENDVDVVADWARTGL